MNSQKTISPALLEKIDAAYAASNKIFKEFQNDNPEAAGLSKVGSESSSKNTAKSTAKTTKSSKTGGKSGGKK